MEKRVVFKVDSPSLLAQWPRHSLAPRKQIRNVISSRCVRLGSHTHIFYYINLNYIGSCWVFYWLQLKNPAGFSDAWISHLGLGKPSTKYEMNCIKHKYFKEDWSITSVTETLTPSHQSQEVPEWLMKLWRLENIFQTPGHIKQLIQSFL